MYILGKKNVFIIKLVLYLLTLIISKYVNRKYQRINIIVFRDLFMMMTMIMMMKMLMLMLLLMMMMMKIMMIMMIMMMMMMIMMMTKNCALSYNK